MKSNFLIGISALIGGIILERKFNVSSKVLKKSESTIEWAKKMQQQVQEKVKEKMQEVKEETAESEDASK